jgi:hypothetical protein
LLQFIKPAAVTWYLEMSLKFPTKVSQLKLYYHNQACGREMSGIVREFEVIKHVKKQNGVT